MADDKNKAVLQIGSVLKLGEGNSDYFTGFSEGYVMLGHIGEAVIYENEHAVLNAMRRDEFFNYDHFNKNTFVIERVVRRLDMPNG